MKDNKNKNKIIGISIGILVVLLVVISSTYAYWQITKSQQDPNSIIAACLDFNVDFPVGISKDNAWPISDSEGMNLDGYTFTVTNNCDTDVNYVIGLESVTSDGIREYLKDESIALAFDNEHLGIYSELTNLQGPSADARGSKELRTATLKGNSTNTHNLKLWIDEESDVSEQGRGFAGKLFITGGQEIENNNPSKITADACFEMNGNEIIGYDEACGKNVVIPGKVNGVAVKTIDSNAFKNEIVEKDVIYYEYSSDEEDYVIVEELDTSLASIKMVLNNYEIGNDESFEKLEYIVVYEDSESMQNLINYAFPQFEQQIGKPIPVYEIYNDGVEEPELLPGQTEAYFIVDAEGNMTIVGYKELKETVMTELSVTDLDLSQAYNLEIIEAGAFTLLELKEYDIDGCTEIMLSIPDFDDELISKGLSNLKFGKQNEIKIGYAAFAGLETEELTIYTNVKPYGHCSAYASIPFLGMNSNILNIEAINNNSIFNFDTLLAPFTASKFATININDGITELGKFTFAGVKSSSINLPDTLVRINENAFATSSAIYGVPTNIIIPNSVNFIGDDAFQGWQNTSTIRFLKTEEEIKNMVTFESADWSGNATVKYAE